MTLADRLRQGKPQGRWSDREVDGLLAGTRMVLEVLKADLVENEPQAGATVECLKQTIEALPETMADVKDLDKLREKGSWKLPNAP